MENQIQNKRPSDEIDLFELINKISHSLKSFFFWIIMISRSFIVLVLRKTIWIFLFSLIGGFSALWFFPKSPNIYRSEMTVRSNSMNNGYLINSINQLNTLIANGKSNTLSENLHINLQQANNILSIQALYGFDFNRDRIVDLIEDNYNPSDSTKKRLNDVFFIRVNILDESLLPFIRNGLIEYISSNTFIANIHKIRKNQVLNQINILNEEINKIDSLQKIQFFNLLRKPKEGNGQMVVLNEKESKLYYNDIINLNNQKLSLEKDMAINPDPLTVIQEFSTSQLAKPDIKPFIQRRIIIYALLGFIISILWQFRKDIWAIIKRDILS